MISYTEKNLLLKGAFSGDALTIFDGGSIESPIIGRYCGDSLPLSLVSSSNKVFINYKDISSYKPSNYKFVKKNEFKLIYMLSSK